MPGTPAVHRIDTCAGRCAKSVGKGTEPVMAEGTRIIVGVSGSLGNMAAVHHAVDEARRRDVPLIPVHAWAPPGGEAAYRRSPCPPLLREWETAAVKRLDGAFERAFGGYPDDLRIQPTVIRGDSAASLVRIAHRPGDLLVVGAGGRGRARRLFHGSTARQCLARARCAVVAVPPSELLVMVQRAWRTNDPTRLLTRCAGTRA